MSDSEPIVLDEKPQVDGGSDWVKLLKWSAIAAILVVVLINVFAGLIPPLLVFAIVWLAGVIWLRRSSKGPAILFLVSFVAFLALSAPFIVPALAVPASPGDFILNIGSVLSAFPGIVASVAVISGRLEGPGAARSVGLGAVGLFVLGVIASIVATVTFEGATSEEGDINVVTRNIEFQDESLEAEAGEVSVFVDNEDATFHSFTIDELEVDLDIPASKSARVTFTAEPGTYRFYCVPHKGLMGGTLTVR